MEARLPEEKLQEIQLLVAEWLDKKKASKRRILSLVGQLQHATKVVKHGRTFVARLYSTAAKVQEMDFLHKTKHGLSLRYMLMACIPAALEWNELAVIDHTSHTE